MLSHLPSCWGFPFRTCLQLSSLSQQGQGGSASENYYNATDDDSEASFHFMVMLCCHHLPSCWGFPYPACLQSSSLSLPFLLLYPIPRPSPLLPVSSLPSSSSPSSHPSSLACLRVHPSFRVLSAFSSTPPRVEFTSIDGNRVSLTAEVGEVWLQGGRRPNGE